MFEREDVIGLLLLGLCVAVGGVLVYSITTGEQFRFTGPGWLGTALMVVFIAAVVYGLVRGRLGSSHRWPDPLTGRAKRRWPWSRGKDDGQR